MFCPPQAVLTLLKPAVQEAGVQLALHQRAITHFVSATRFASFVRRGDLADASARLLWNAAKGLVVTPPTKCALVAPLTTAVEALNAAKPKDTVFQVGALCDTDHSQAATVHYESSSVLWLGAVG